MLILSDTIVVAVKYVLLHVDILQIDGIRKW